MKQISIAPAVVAAIAAHSFPMAANAQSITVAPAAAVAATAIPVDNPWSLLALAIGLAMAAWLVLRNRQHRALFMALCTSAIVCATLWHSPDLRAQLTGSFTNPAGETRPLLVAQIVNGGNINGFSAEDFTNDSGVALKITAIQPPNLNQCFPSGFTHLMPPGAPPASPPPLCAVGNTIATNGTCRVNVETICRAEAAQATAGASPTTLSVPGAGLSFAAGSTGTVNVSNSGGSAALNVQATIPAGSGITISSNSCAATLPAGSSCAITLTAPAAEGPTTVSIAGSNAAATTTPVTVTGGPAPTTTLSIPATPLSFAAGSTGSVTITNSGGANALNVQASIPAGSGITVSNTTCPAALAPSANCTITLTAPSAEGPTAIGFGGSNTPATTMPVTVTNPVTPTTLSMPSTPVSFDTGGAGSVTITNSGSAPAFNVQASIPVGSGITVSNTTCSAILAPSANCTITLTAPAAEGPTNISFGGSNTPTTTVQVTVTVPVPTTTLSIPSAPLSFAAGGSTTVLISNTGASAAFNVTATAPAGSGITVQSNTCGAALASLASCGITLTAAAAEGPTAISFGGSNTLATTVPVTVTAPVTPTTLGMSTTPVSFNTGTTGSVTITNNGGAPALDVQATIPAGSGITVSANTCGSSLAAGANCIITLTASAAEGPTPVSFAGSNTSATTVPFTVTAPSTTTTLGISASTLTIAPGGTGFVTITNTGSNAAANIGATIPGGSGLSVSGNTCGLSLPAGVTCTVTFTAGSDEGPTNVTIQGSNTDTAALSITVSGSIDIGAYHLDGSCGVLGVLGPGFTLTAGSAPLPVGTTVTIIGSGVANIGVFSVTGGTASVSVLSATSRQVTLTSALPAGATIAFRTTLSISVAFTLNGSTTLPNGYAGTGGKPAGSVSSTLVLCSAT
ncbi:midcut-by-XrtH protein [Delftia sp. Lp-1]|nr:midcut-by-XrtH protein [Delftia sp. Lp-1]